MAKQPSSELSRRFKEFTRRTLRHQSREVVRLEGGLFKRRAVDPLARITRQDFMTPISSRATVGPVDIQWVAARAGGWWNRRYYLVSVHVIGNTQTQELHYQLIEYRFAGVGKFQRDPQRRKRQIAINQPFDPKVLSCLDDLDKHWTGRERRFGREQVLERFKEPLRF